MKKNITKEEEKAPRNNENTEEFRKPTPRRS